MKAENYIQYLREPAYDRASITKELDDLIDKIPRDLISKHDLAELKRLSKDIQSSLYWMQLRLTNAEEWLKEEETIEYGRDQKTIDRLRNVRDALPWFQPRWSGEDNG